MLLRYRFGDVWIYCWRCPVRTPRYGICRAGMYYLTRAPLIYSTILGVCMNRSVAICERLIVFTSNDMMIGRSSRCRRLIINANARDGATVYNLSNIAVITQNVGHLP